MIETNKVYKMEALELLKQLPDNSIDLVLTDPPYNMTALKWDKEIDLEELWKEFKRVGKENCAFIFMASQPFTSILVTSNLSMFKHEWIWEKQKASNFLSMKYCPAKYHENIIVFCKGKPKYIPQKWYVEESQIDKRKTRNSHFVKGDSHVGNIIRTRYVDDGSRYPKSVIFFPKKTNGNKHPTQKPIKLMEYLVKTYTDEKDVVLDCFVGSGTTAVACKKLNRNFICSDINEDYVKIAESRLSETAPVVTLASPTFPTEKAINKDLTAQDKPSPKCPSDTSLNPDIIGNFKNPLVSLEKLTTKRFI
jgi:site-specific DNA-methyltransferase (adenine-specific)